MYDYYTKALAVLEVLEWAERRIYSNEPFRVVSRLRRKGLYQEKTVSYLMDSLRPNEALRFRNAMATIESHFARLSHEDREFIRVEGPATTGFYLSYLNGEHEFIVDLSYKMLVGERVFPGVRSDLIDTASALLSSPAWIVRVLIPNLHPYKQILARSVAHRLVYTALEYTRNKPIPHQYTNQLIDIQKRLNEMHY